MYVSFEEIFIFILVCLLVSLGIARWRFRRWQYKDKCEGGIMMDRGGVCYDQEECWTHVKHRLQHEVSDQYASLSAENQKYVSEEKADFRGILGYGYDWKSNTHNGYGKFGLTDMQHFFRLLYILNLDIIIFRKKYKGAVLKALKDAGASALCLAITIAHFAVVVCFVGVTFIPFVTLKAVPPMRQASKATMTAMRTFFASICW